MNSAGMIGVYNWSTLALDTQTGGRLKRWNHYLREGTFMLTYGDGVSNVDLA